MAQTPSLGRLPLWHSRFVVAERVESLRRTLQGLERHMRVGFHHRAGVPAPEPL